jgi:acyl dehydratase/NAD(P)-dependent dehydrogenase (short-subunit alcohol dehydrogenase family)
MDDRASEVTTFTEDPEGMTFSPQLHTEFADLSGDWNPMHMSALDARRTQAGRPVVHGLHTVLATLERLTPAAGAPPPSHLTVRFHKPVYIGDRATPIVAELGERERRIEVRVDGLTVVTLAIRIGAGAARTRSAARGGPPLLGSRGQKPRARSFEETSVGEGVVDPVSPAARIAACFPRLADWIGVERVTGLLCLSRLVGMECPGLHSLFSSFSVELDARCAAPNLNYRVAGADRRFRLVKLDVSGLGIRGRVEAFVRHLPVAQPEMAALETLVDRREFAGQRALVVGGSRGLGEVTAKLLAAGGGRPIITYAVGQDDAAHVIDQIRRWGGVCEAIRYDVRASATAQLAPLVGPVPYLYYYASGQIHRRRTARFGAALLEDFLTFYVRGFYDLCMALRGPTERALSVLYPSSVAVRERPREMTEYAMAKAAGEVLCRDLSRSSAGLRILTARLPRVLTDQTATVAAAVAPGESATAAQLLVPLIRAVQAARL